METANGSKVGTEASSWTLEWSGRSRGGRWTWATCGNRKTKGLRCPSLVYSYWLINAVLCSLLLSTLLLAATFRSRHMFVGRLVSGILKPQPLLLSQALVAYTVEQGWLFPQ